MTALFIPLQQVRQKVQLDAKVVGRFGPYLKPYKSEVALAFVGMTLQSIWNFNANLAKQFRIDETRVVQIRIDTNNVLNNPRPNDPSLNLNSNEETNPFGRINQKGNQIRTFQGQVRLQF